MRKILLALALFCPLHAFAGVPQSSSAPGLQPSANLSDVLSIGTSNRNIGPVSRRAPNDSDTFGYSAGQRWLDLNTNQLYQYSSVGTAGFWAPASPPTTNTGSAASITPVFWCGTRRGIAGYAGALFTVERATDLATQIITQFSDGSPDIPTLVEFLKSSNGIGYVIKCNDEISSNDGVVPQIAAGVYNLASAPMIDTSLIVGTNVPMAQSTAMKNYYGTATSVNGTWSSGNTFTITTPTNPANIPFLLPGMILTGTNIASTTASVTSANTSTGVLTLSGTVAAPFLKGIPITCSNSACPGGAVISAATLGAGTLTITPAPAIGTAFTITASSMVTAVNYSTNVVTLTANPTGNPSNAHYATPYAGDFFNIPNVTTHWQSWSCFVTAQLGGQSAQQFRPCTVGVGGDDASVASGSWAYLFFPGNASKGGMRIVNGNSLGNSSSSLGALWSAAPQSISIATGGANGRSVTWQLAGQQGALTNSFPAVPASTFTGAAVGCNQQLSNNACSDYLFYDVGFWDGTLTAADMSAMTAAASYARGWPEQINASVVCDGSSTTIGSGWLSPVVWCEQIALRLSSIYPVQSYNQAVGTTIEWGNANFSLFGGGLTTAQKGNHPLLFLYPGEGNSLQQFGNLSVTSGNMSTGVLVTATNVSPFSPGVSVTCSNSACPGGAVITAAPPGGTSMTISPAPAISTAFTLTAVNDTGARAWNNIVSYCSTAASFGYRIVLIGSATRGPFNGSQATEFSNLKVFSRNHKGDCTNLAAYIDLETQPIWGGQITPMTISSFTGSSVTVPSLSPYLAGNSGQMPAVGDRIWWSGMPDSIGSDTGGQTVSSITPASTLSITSGNTTTGVLVASTITAPFDTIGLAVTCSPATACPGGSTITASTLGGTSMTISPVPAVGTAFTMQAGPYTLGTSGSTSGMVVNAQVNTINPTPWTSYQSYWGADNQHFQAPGYRAMGDWFSSTAIANSLLLKHHEAFNDRWANDNYQAAANDNLSPRFSRNVDQFSAAMP